MSFCSSLPKLRLNGIFIFFLYAFQVVGTQYKSNDKQIEPIYEFGINQIVRNQTNRKPQPRIYAFLFFSSYYEIDLRTNGRQKNSFAFIIYQCKIFGRSIASICHSYYAIDMTMSGIYSYYKSRMRTNILT